MTSILVVEDSLEEQELIRRAIRDEFELSFAASAREAREQLVREQPDLILLDALLPDSPGIELCTQLRDDPRVSETPIVFLTSCRETSNKVMAFQLGADDYVEKPFVPEELRARLRARLRRERPENRTVLSFSDFRIDVARHQAWIRTSATERLADLTPLEFRIMHTLAVKRGSPISRARLIESVWGRVALSARTVDTHVSNLRRKLDPHGHRIQAVRGIGYVLAEPVTDAQPVRAI